MFSNRIQVSAIFECYDGAGLLSIDGGHTRLELTAQSDRLSAKIDILRIRSWSDDDNVPVRRGVDGVLNRLITSG